MKNILFYFISIIICNISIAQQTTISVEKNYNNWKWDSVYVAKNQFISIAVVPKAAGRILEYNLGDIPSLWLNPKLLGKSFESTDLVKRNEWRNFGGYRLVPLPIENCAINSEGEKIQRWPPPAIIGDSPYNAEITTNKEGYKSILVSSGIQNLPVPTYNNKTNSFNLPNSIDEQLQYSRSLYIKPNSSLVYIKHNLKNVGDKIVKRGIMTSSQHVSRSKPELEDGENFLAYVPFDKKYKLPSGKQYEIMGTADSRWQYVSRNRMPLDKNNPDHVKRFYNNGTNWTGEVAHGIFEMHYDYYLMSGFHIISSKAWVCYVNKIEKTVFAKILEPYNPKLKYDHGLNVSIFMSGMETGYLETEVKTPIYTLHPGKSFEYKEIHGAAKVSSLPVIDVNKTGVITKKLSFDTKVNALNGSYGVFYEGDAILRLMDNSNNIIKNIVLEKVNPLNAFTINHTLQKYKKASKIILLIKVDNSNEHILDEVNLKEY
ncbi:hypothetical protein EGM88_12765 [Aureibaculum marinum]|uniref:DUF4380 domain-containing protein n=1 Tax=Aureibaculum marinum TaxID=2487930 RepID=A0A3N4NF33_9FLAO|nr:hypothetical protein [Aureibaculum marinum]RPD93368.1 hypothetical protein EGM88_12765 [Aureibaculum marinum]